MNARLHVIERPAYAPGQHRALADRIRLGSGVEISGVAVSRCYEIHGVDAEVVAWMGRELLTDPVTETFRTDAEVPTGLWRILVTWRPGVTDNEGATASGAARIAARQGMLPGLADVVVRSGRLYEIQGNLSAHDANRIAGEVLANGLVQRWSVAAPGQPLAAVEPLGVPRPFSAPAPFEVRPLPATDAELQAFSREAMLALSVAELRAVEAQFARAKEQERRAALGLPRHPTDVELEAIAQTWSEHCKHKVFNDPIMVEDGGNTRTIDRGLFKTFIRDATQTVATERPWLVSVFEDNAGVIRWEPGYHVVFKVETHNAPSAVEPYGGALTGIVGVHRDPAATGLGARLIFNTNVFCFAPPECPDVPRGALPPRRIIDGVRRGVEDGGNQSGIPTINGAVFFDDRFAARPLVFCGAAALMDETTAGLPTHEKHIVPGDLIVMAGGRVGRDGIHGATFSSATVTHDAPASVVQIGDPITQKKLLDFLAEARVRGWIRAITDNGAGGLSSSVGELARLCNGAHLDLDQVPTKMPGLAPWEILVSESQERMTLAVDPSHWPALHTLAERRDVEISAIGHFNADGLFSASWQKMPVMSLPLDFLHHGLPHRILHARIAAVPPHAGPSSPPPSSEFPEILRALLASRNICSREPIIRQYDHEVQAGTVVKPLGGPRGTAPNDGAVHRPLPTSNAGVAVGCAINPQYGDLDPYLTAVHLVDEAIRNVVALGADPDHLALLDNFCWPDPVFDPVKNPDGREKLGALVRTCEGLRDAVVGFGAPLISGKDSVKNDYHGPDGKRSIPPTLLVSSIARVPDATRAVTSDLKIAGDFLYLVGPAAVSLGGSQVAQLRGCEQPPLVDLDIAAARDRYRRLHRAMQEGLVAACHDCSDGGLAVALAEMMFGAERGVKAELGERATSDWLSDWFGEGPGRLVVEVSPDHAGPFEALMGGAVVRLGVVTAAPALEVRMRDGTHHTIPTEPMLSAWRGGLSW